MARTSRTAQHIATVRPVAIVTNIDDNGKTDTLYL